MSDPRTDFFSAGAQGAPDDSTAPTDARTSFFADDKPQAVASSAEPAYDAALFKQRVGRDPEPAELAHFKAFKGVGFAGDPTQGKFTAGEAALGAVEDATTLGTGAVAAIPAAVGYLAGATGLTDSDSLSNARSVRSAMTYQPRTEAGQAGMEAIGQIKPGEIAPRLLDVSGHPQAADTVRELEERAADVAPLVPEIAAGFPSARGIGNRFVSSIKDPESATTTAAAPTGPGSSAPSKSMGAAQVNPSPFTLTGQETGRGSPSFPQVKLAKNSGDVPADEQSTRAGIVKEVLNDSGEDAGIRTGVLTGNEQTLRSEYQAAKNPNQTPADILMSNQIAAEQRALPKFAQKRVDATGADPTLTNDYQRGETINGAFYGEGGLRDYLDQQKSKVYQAALEKNGANQIPIDTTDSMFKDPQFAAGSKLLKHESVVGGAQDLLNLAKTVGFKDPITGVQYAPGTVAAYHAVTKALNRGWTPENSVTIGKINGAINEDVAKSGGADLYQLGSKIHQLDKGLLSDSAGIKDVFGEVDPNGIQTGKDFDRIPKTLNNMPLDQWRHIHDTLDSVSRGHLPGAPEGMDPVPPELMQAAGRAKAEMHGALAREVYSQGAGKVGGWNANSANQTLNSRVGQKILDALPPDEIRKFQVLNAAGHIMPGAHPYEGAGAQTARMGNEPGFVENYAPKAGILLGAKTLIPGAPLVGEKIGEKVSGLTKGRREAKQAANVSQTLRDNLARATGGRVARAEGGKVDHEVLLSRLVQRYKAAKKMNDAGTETLLKAPDASIIRALDIAGRSATL